MGLIVLLFCGRFGKVKGYGRKFRKKFKRGKFGYNFGDNGFMS